MSKFEKCTNPDCSDNATHGFISYNKETGEIDNIVNLCDTHFGQRTITFLSKSMIIIAKDINNVAG